MSRTGIQFLFRLVFDRNFGIIALVMGVLKTFTLIVPLLCFTLGANAGPSATDRAREFATCAGRLSAMIEHTWLMMRGDAAREQDRRRDFDSLIAAILPHARSEGLTGPELLHLRLEAKFALARLLQQADLTGDAATAAHARATARRHLAACEGQLLG